MQRARESTHPTAAHGTQMICVDFQTHTSKATAVDDLRRRSASYGFSKHSFPFSAAPFHGRIFGSEPKRGDVIVFRYPLDIRQNYVKRLMGMPGDRIHILNKVVYLNGKPLQEPYAQHIFPDQEPYRDVFPMSAEEATPIIARNVPPDRALEMLSHVQNGELVVPEGQYFAMGDNRDNSSDSRFPSIPGSPGVGFVPFDNLEGRAEIIFFSVKDGAPAWMFWQWPWTVRWGRLFTLL